MPVTGYRRMDHPLLMVLGALSVSAWYLLSNRVSKARKALSNGSLSDASADDAREDETTPMVAQEVLTLRKKYDGIASDFVKQGLDVKSIADLLPWFHMEGMLPWPKRYDVMSPAYPPDAVRILVIPLADSPPIASMAAAAAAKVAALLPDGTKIFSNSRQQYHCTMFHTSHPVDARPNPLLPSGGLTQPPLPSVERGPYTRSTLDRESRAMRAVVEGSGAPHLELHSLVMTRTGTLLLTWVDHSGKVTELRQKLHVAFPGATSKQSNIIHTTLFRVLTPEQLTSDVIEDIQSTCSQLSRKFQGKHFRPSTMWWVHETEFSTVIGPKEIITL